MFIGREKELDTIGEVLALPSCCVLVYGKRRVGKTTLLMHALEGSADKTLYFECTPTTMERNADKFVDVMLNNGVIDFRISVRDFDDAFAFLDRLGETFNVVIDEYQFLKKESSSSSVDGMFQRIADNRLSHIRLFICGSHAGMMQELLNSVNPLYGRFKRIIELEEWDYREAAAVYPNLSAYDKVAFYSVFGGSPYINCELNPAKSLKENILDMYVKRDGVAFVYVNFLLMTSSSQWNAVADVLESIGNGRRKFTEIKDRSGIDDNARLTRMLNTAISLKLVKKTYPVNKPGDFKKARYEIADNVVRFYYTFVFRNLSALGQISPENFYELYIEPGLNEFISRRFEDICRMYFSLQNWAGNYKDVMEIGTYYYDNPSEKKNGEFDVVLKKKLGFDVYEAKYLSSEMTARMVEDETRDIMEIEGLPVDKVGFISVNGFEDGCEGVLITGDDLYE